jgi:hypothetical protein
MVFPAMADTRDDRFFQTAGTLKLMALKQYRHGFLGFVETDRRYLYFQFARGELKLLQTYSKQDYESTDHFISVIGKFVHASFFFKRPIPLAAVTEETLSNVIREHDKV